MTDEQRKRIHKIVYSCDDRAELAERIVALEEENAKLRDLALNCYRMAKQLGPKCKRHCSHWPECCENDSLEHCEPCRLTALAQELGIDMLGE